MNNRWSSGQLWLGWAHLGSGSNLLHLSLILWPRQHKQKLPGEMFFSQMVTGVQEAKTNYARVCETSTGTWGISHLLTLHWPKLITWLNPKEMGQGGILHPLSGTVKSHGNGHGWKILIHGGSRIVGNILIQQSLHFYSRNPINLLLSTFAVSSSSIAELEI